MRTKIEKESDYFCDSVIRSLFPDDPICGTPKGRKSIFVVFNKTL